MKNRTGIELDKAETKAGRMMRPGAPRKHPNLVKVPVGLKLPRWLLDWMRQQDQSMAVLIEDALRKRHKLKPSNAELTGRAEGEGPR